MNVYDGTSYTETLEKDKSSETKGWARCEAEWKADQVYLCTYSILLSCRLWYKLL